MAAGLQPGGTSGGAETGEAGEVGEVAGMVVGGQTSAGVHQLGRVVDVHARGVAVLAVTLSSLKRRTPPRSCRVVHATTTFVVIGCAVTPGLEC